MNGQPTSFTLKHWGVILGPAIAALGLVLHFSVDVPYMDEWDTPLGMYVGILDGKLGFFDQLLAQHNESRDAFPRLIFLAVGLTIGWHGPIFVVASWVCAAVTLLLLVRLLPDPTGRHGFGFVAVGTLLGGLLFVLTQWENQLWGIQLIVFLPPLCIALCLWLQSTRASVGVTVVTCALLSVIATFSYANGLLCWLLGFPLLKVWPAEGGTAAPGERRSRVLWTALYAVLAAGTAVFYFRDYTTPVNAPPVTAALQSPGLALQYLAAWTGAPFVPGHILRATLVGGAILLAVLVTVAILLREWRRTSRGEVVTACYPWVCLTAYGVLTGLLITVGRTGGGLPSAVASRYCTFALWATVGLVGLLYALWRSVTPRQRPVMNATLGTTVSVIALLTAAGWVNGFSHMQAAHQRARQNLLTLRLLEVAPANPLLRRLYPRPDAVRERARVLIRHGILPIDLIGAWLPDKLTRPDGSTAGVFTVRGQAENIARVTGWTTLPGAATPDCVILARRGTTGATEPIAGFITHPTGADGRSRFSDTLELPTSSVASVDHLAMFAVDLDGHGVYELTHDRPRSTLVAYTFAKHLSTADIISGGPDFVLQSEVPFVIGDQRRLVFFEHPNSEVVFKDVPIPTNARLEFGIGINAAAWDMPGDGVSFDVALRDPAGRDHRLYSRWIDPKNNVEDRKWLEAVVDLRAFSGQTVSFAFTTGAGPQGNRDSDWAGWSNPQIVVTAPP